MDAATSARIALEKQLENLEVELEFLRRVHKQVIESAINKLLTTKNKLYVKPECLIFLGNRGANETDIRSARISNGRIQSARPLKRAQADSKPV